MAIYSFTQPAAPSFIQTSTGTAASDTYILSINSALTPPLKGLWVINDRDSARDIFQYNVTLDAQGRFRGPAPGMMELTGGNSTASDNNNLVATFSDLRTNPLAFRFNGFNPSDDTFSINLFNSAGVLLPDGTGTISNFYRSNSTHLDSSLNLNVYDFLSTTETWGSGPSSETGLVVDVSRATSEFVTYLNTISATLPNYEWIDIIFDEDAFVGLSDGLDLRSVPNINNINLRFDLSANANNNQGIKETNDGWWDTVNYSQEGVDANGDPSYVTNTSNLRTLTLDWNSVGTTVNRSLDVNGSTQTRTDTFNGIEFFSLTSGADTINIDMRNLNNYANIASRGGNDEFFLRTSPGAGNTYGGVLLEFGDSDYDFEKYGVFGNFTGQSQTRLYKPTVGPDYSLSLNSSLNQDGSAVARVYDTFGGTDILTFSSAANVNDFVVGGSKFSDRFYVGDLGLSGEINIFTMRGGAGYDVLRVTDESPSGALENISIVMDYTFANYEIKDPNTRDDISSLPISVYSGVIQKGDRGIYGIDRVQREKNAVIHSEEYILNNEANYLEWNVNSSAKQLVFQLGGGADRAYIKPLLNDINDVIMVDFSQFMGGDGARDTLEIDLKGILDQIPDLTSSTNTNIVLTGVESQDLIKFVNPSTGGMTRTAYDDDNAGTTNDSQLGWTFTKTQISGANTYTHKVNVLFQDSFTGVTLGNSQVNALTATTTTVSSRTVFDYPTYAMTAGIDNAILFEDSGNPSFYNFLAGDDFVILRDGNLDVVLGAGDDFAAVAGNVGEAIVIGGTGNDTVGLNGLIGINGQQSDWVFTTMDVATARTVFANKYALNPTANPFEIELSASGLEVVTVAQRFEGGATWSLVDKKYTGVGDVLQTVYLQAETVSSVDSGDVAVDSLYGSRDFSATLSAAGTFNYYGRRGTEDSLTITLADGNALATAMSNINNWFVTSVATQATLNGSVLSGSHVSTITGSAMGITGATAIYNMVDLEKITLRGGSEQVTIRLAGSNGYVSVAEAVNAADFKDVIFIAKTIETSSTNPNLLNSVANQTTIDIPAGLGIVFEPVTTSTVHKVNITDQMVADAPVNADRLVYLLGRQNIDVKGSVLSDMIIGNQGNNVIYGGGGNDVIYGGGGNDTLFGQAGSDLLIGSAGNDFLNGGTGDDTLVTYGTKRTSAAAADRTNMIGGSGHDEFIFLSGQGSHVMYGGSGEDGYTILPGWENGLNRIGTTAQQETINGTGTVLDFSTTSDYIEGKSLGSGSPESYLASVNLTFNQLVSPPRPLGSSYDPVTFSNGTTMQANADAFAISPQTNLGSLLEDYGLMNDVAEYRLQQAA